MVAPGAIVVSDFAYTPARNIQMYNTFLLTRLTGPGTDFAKSAKRKRCDDIRMSESHIVYGKHCNSDTYNCMYIFRTYTLSVITDSNSNNYSEIVIV